MKKMSLFLVGIVLMLGFAGFVFAEVNDTLLDENQTEQVNSSFDNDTAVVLSLGDDLGGSDEINETVLNDTLLDENQTDQVVEDLVVDELVVDELVIEDEGVVEDKESAFDVVLSYGSDVIGRINGIHENLFLAILVVLWVLLLIIYSIFYDTSSAEACFSKASALHRRATIAHVNGDYEKAKKLYGKSHLLRGKGEKKVDLEN